MGTLGGCEVSAIGVDWMTRYGNGAKIIIDISEEEWDKRNTMYYQCTRDVEGNFYHAESDGYVSIFFQTNNNYDGYGGAAFILESTSHDKSFFLLGPWSSGAYACPMLGHHRPVPVLIRVSPYCSYSGLAHVDTVIELINEYRPELLPAISTQINGGHTEAVNDTEVIIDKTMFKELYDKDLDTDHR